MSKEQVKDPAAELEMARTALQEAKQILSISPRMAAREAYLIAFHAAQARLGALGLPSGTHKGVGIEIGKLYKGTDYSAQRKLSELESWKAAADYGRGAAADEPAATQALKDAEIFLNRMVKDIGDLGPQKGLTPEQIAKLESMKRESTVPCN